MSDELSGEGATEFEDIEGGGLGEGEGTKDVSDQIESEDQVRMGWDIVTISKVRYRHGDGLVKDCGNSSALTHYGLAMP